MPPYDPAIQHRRSIRLKDYDYSQPGAYFITMCTRGGALIFGDMDGEEVRLNEVGKMLYSLWADIPSAYPPADIDVFIVMPNHLHGIIVLPDTTEVRRGEAGMGTKVPVSETPSTDEDAMSIDYLVGRVKSLAINRYWDVLRSKGRSSAHVKLWHRDYYEHVIRNEDELARIREYITNNPLQWSLDRENPNRKGTNPTEDWLFGDGE